MKFQFHKGTIKPEDSYLIKERLTQFQFHKGTIKPPIKMYNYEN